MELRGIQSSEVPATEVCTPQVLTGIFEGEPLRRAEQPREQPRPEKPELPPEEKRS